MKTWNRFALASSVILLAARPGVCQQTGPFPLAPTPTTSQNRVAQFGTVRPGVAQGPAAPSTVVPPAIPERPFSNYQAPPTISPWMGLYQFNRNIALPNYYQYVRPQVEQNQLSRDIAQQQQSIQNLRTATQLGQQQTEALQAQNQSINTTLGDLAGQTKAQQQFNNAVQTTSRERGATVDDLARLAEGQQQVIQALRAGEPVPDATIQELNVLAKKVLSQLEEGRTKPAAAPPVTP